MYSCFFDAKLSEDDLNALIAHAHLRVDQLRRQLTDQQLREEQHISEAIEQQKAEDKRIAENKLHLEMDRINGEYDVILERKLAEKQTVWEEQLRSQLRRAAAAHSEHLEEVVRAQKELLELDHANVLNKAVQEERNNFHTQMGVALAKMMAIEAALQDRAIQDADNRRAKELWLACQNLVQSVVHGRKGGIDCESRRRPLATELTAIRETCASDPFVNVVFKSLDDEVLYDGVYTEADLKSRFLKVYKLGWRTAKIDDNGGTLFQYLWSALMSSIIVDVGKYVDKIDVQKNDIYSILSLAKCSLLDRGDILATIRLMQLLTGEPARIAKSWLNDARLHLEAKQAAELLVAHATNSSLRTVY